MKYSIKPLEFARAENGYGGHYHYASTPFGCFLAEESDQGWMWSFPDIENDSSSRGFTEEEAIAAAQAHWEEHLKQALKEEK